MIDDPDGMPDTNQCCAAYPDCLHRHDRREDAEIDERCLFGSACLCPHFYHTSAECYTLEMAEAFEVEAASDDDEDRTVPTSIETSEEADQRRLLEGAVFCNYCGALIYFPERGIIPFDGRFCDHECMGGFELKRTHHIMRKR